MQNNPGVQVRLFTHPILTNSNDANARVGLHSDFGVLGVRAEKTDGYI